MKAPVLRGSEGGEWGVCSIPVPASLWALCSVGDSWGHQRGLRGWCWSPAPPMGSQTAEA